MFFCLPTWLRSPSLTHTVVTSILLVAAVLAALDTAGAQEPATTSRTALAASGAAAASSPQLQASQALPAAIAPAPTAPASTSIDLLIQRVESLARAVDSAASSARQPYVDPWQDLKALILNVLSNRVDHILFGDGKGSVGLAAQVVAILAFIIAVIRLMMAVALLNPATPQTKWGEFKAWTRKSGVVRAINVVVGALAVLFTAAALYVVMAARAVPDASAASLATLKDGLASCQAALASRPERTREQSAGAQATATGITLEAMQRYSAACEGAIRATDARVVEIGQTVDAIDAKQSWTMTKVLAFLAWLYLLGGVTYLVVKRLET